MIESVLTSLDASILASTASVTSLLESAKDSHFGGERYGAFPLTHTTPPLDGVPSLPNRLTENYPNEVHSLDDIGFDTTFFNDVAACVSRYDNGGTGYYIEYRTRVTVVDADDLTYLLTQLNGFEDTLVGEVVTVIKQVDYSGVQFNTNWHHDYDINLVA